MMVGCTHAGAPVLYVDADPPAEHYGVLDGLNMELFADALPAAVPRYTGAKRHDQRAAAVAWLVLRCDLATEGVQELLIAMAADAALVPSLDVLRRAAAGASAAGLVAVCEAFAAPLWARGREAVTPATALRVALDDPTACLLLLDPARAGCGDRPTAELWAAAARRWPDAAPCLDALQALCRCATSMEPLVLLATVGALHGGAAGAGTPEAGRPLDGVYAPAAWHAPAHPAVVRFAAAYRAAACKGAVGTLAHMVRTRSVCVFDPSRECIA